MTLEVLFPNGNSNQNPHVVWLSSDLTQTISKLYCNTMDVVAVMRMDTRCALSERDRPPSRTFSIVSLLSNLKSPLFRSSEEMRNHTELIPLMGICTSRAFREWMHKLKSHILLGGIPMVNLGILKNMNTRVYRGNPYVFWNFIFTVGIPPKKIWTPGFIGKSLCILKFYIYPPKKIWTPGAYYEMLYLQ